MSLPHFSLSAAWTAAGWTMVHLIWTGLLIGIVAAVLRRSLRTARAETRHAVAVGGLMVLCLAAVILFAVMYEPERGTSEVARLAAQLDAKATVDFAKASPRPLLPVTFDVQMKSGRSHDFRVVTAEPDCRLPAWNLALRLAGNTGLSGDGPGRGRAASARGPADRIGRDYRTVPGARDVDRPDAVIPGRDLRPGHSTDRYRHPPANDFAAASRDHPVANRAARNGALARACSHTQT